ncbi:helix-turn-helix transcriptional regulator, partial [Aetokthonos hydrillicola]
MKQDSKLRNNLKSIRTRLKMSQQDLADLAGVTRQTISGVEAGQYAPSVVITLRLAKALGCQVEDIFSLEQDVPEIEAVAAKPFTDGQRSRVSVARVGGQWIAYPLIGKDAFRQDMIPADGEAIGVGRHSDPNDFPKEELPKQSSYISNPPNPDGETKKQVSTNRVRVKLLDDNLDTLHNTVVIAGCAPVISLWARATERWHPQLR